jgi:hypothetical protein
MSGAPGNRALANAPDRMPVRANIRTDQPADGADQRIRASSPTERVWRGGEASVGGRE